MRCELCGRDTHCLVSYKGFKTKIKFCCTTCFLALKEKKKKIEKK